MSGGGGFVVADNVWFCAGGREVLRGESFAIGGGDALAVCGENGAGKTTLLKILAGLLPPDEGKVHYHCRGGTMDSRLRGNDGGGGTMDSRLRGNDDGGGTMDSRLRGNDDGGGTMDSRLRGNDDGGETMDSRLRGNDGGGGTMDSRLRGNDGGGGTMDSRLRGNDDGGETMDSRLRGNDGCGEKNDGCGEENDGGGEAIDDWRENIVYVGHKTGICADLTPLENLRVFAAMRARRPRLDLSAALKCWHADADIPCARLSAGQLRRAALARLSAFAAKVWLLDEPLASLDAPGRGRFFAELRRHLQEGGGAAISCHHPDELPNAARVIRLCR